MDLLVLGGTGWLSREVVREALARGHAVTCLSRGRAGPGVEGARSVTADRDLPDAYDTVTAERWDAVVDVARQPGHVRRAVAALGPVAERYLFVSSVSVYADQAEPGADEGAALLPPLDSDVMQSMETYGEAKVACEKTVLAEFGADRSLLARAGLIGGPGDSSGRSGYWPWRFAHPSNPEQAVLVPDDPQVPTAVVDVRDLAGWLVGCAEARISGTFNVSGETRLLADHLAVARSVAGHSGPLVPAPGAWLTEQGVVSWMGPRSLPLWLDDPAWHGMNACNADRARAAGLVHRPLEETLADVLAWEEARPEPGPHGAGLGDAEERQLLALLRESGATS